MKNYEKIRKILANPRLRAIMNCYFNEGKSKLKFGKIYKKLSSHPRDSYTGEIIGDPILKNMAQLRRDMVTLETLGAVKRIDWGTYELSNKYYKQLIKDEMLIGLESYPSEMTLFEGNIAIFGLIPEEIEDSFQEEYNNILIEMKKFCNKLEELWMKIRLNEISDSLERTLSNPKFSLDKKAWLYKKINDYVTINLANRRMNTDYHQDIFKPYIEQIKNPKVKNIKKIIKKSSQLEDELKGLKDDNGISVINEIRKEMWQEKIESTVSTFDNLIEEGKISLSSEKILKIRKLLKKKEKISTDFRYSIYQLGFDAPMVVLNPRMNYSESDLFLVPFSQD